MTCEMETLPREDEPMGPHCDYPGHRPPLPIPLVTIPEHPCPYLPGRLAMTRAFAASEFPGELYHQFMDAGFRRDGEIFYQPICRGCRACLPIRMRVAGYMPNKSQRRVWRRNADLRVSIAQPLANDEKFDLFSRYESVRHPRDTPMDDAARPGMRESFESFLYRSPVETLEFCYRDGAGRLLAAGIADICSKSLSSVYFYYDPSEASRGLGTFSVMREITYARELGVEHYYLGFWVADCPKMRYKAHFGPCEVRHPDGIWRAPQNSGA